MKIYNPTGFSSSLTGSFSGSVKGTFEGSFSGGTLNSISGAFTQDSSSFASRIDDLETFETNIDNTYATDAQLATAVSGLNADSSSYLKNTTDTLTGDLTVTGTITAQEFHTEFVSASILYDSGSTKFGDTSDDNHEFTGSVKVKGGVEAAGDFISTVSAYTIGTTSDTNLELATSTNANPRMLFRVNGSSERMRIDESGNLQVGISSLTGSADPRVTVGSKGNYYPGSGTGLGDLHIGDGNYGLSIGTALGGAGAGDTRIWTTGGTHKIVFLTNDTDYRLTINSAGNIGVGLFDASYKLDVVGFSRFNNGFYLQEATAGTNAAFSLNSDQTLELEAFGATGAIAFSVGSSITEAVRIGTDAQTTFNNNIRFGTGDGVDWKIVGNANGPLIKLRRNSATSDRYGVLGWRDNGSAEYDAIKWRDTTVTMPGSLGIGTTAPVYTFHVGKSITNDWVGIINNTYDGAGNGLLIDAGNGTSGEILRLRDRNGNSKVSFLSNGNVGIGTTSPNVKLDVRGYITSDASNNGSEAGFYLGNSAHGLTRANLANDITLYTTSGDVKISASTASTTHLIVKNSGMVGIGTTSPSHRFEIKGTSAAFTTDTDMRFYINRPSDSYLGSIIFTTGGAAVGNGWAEIGQTSANGDLYFKANVSAASYNTRMIIKGADGNVGIGTTSPTRNLQVHGTTTTKFLVSTSGVADAYIEVQGYDAGLHIGDYTNGNRYAIWNDGVSTTSTLNFGSYALGTWYAPGSQIMTMTHNGNVGIGTMSPVAKLDVNGTHRFRGDTYSEYTWTASGNYTSGTYYDIVNSAEGILSGIYTIACYVDTYAAGGSIYFMWFASVPFYWVNTGTNNTNFQDLPTVLGTGHARNSVTPPTFRLQQTSGATDGKMRLRFNPNANWTGMDNTSGKSFRVYLKRLGG